MAFDHGRTLLGCRDDVSKALSYLKSPERPKSHPMAGALERDHCEKMVQRIRSVQEELIYEVCELGDTCGSVMPAEQVVLGEALVERRELLPRIVERVLFAEEPISGRPS